MSPSASWISIDSSSRVVTVSETDTSNASGSATTFTVTSTLNDGSSTNDNGYSFAIRLDNPCAGMTAPSVSDVTYQLGNGAETWTIADWTKDAACTWTETLTISPSNIAWMSLSSRTISISETNTSLHGNSQAFTVTSTLDDGATTSDNSYTFTVTLNNPCIGMSAPSVSDVTYLIGTGPSSWTIADWTKDAACSFSETLSISPSNISWLSLTTRTIKILETDVS